jgi:aminopeptidase N
MMRFSRLMVFAAFLLSLALAQVASTASLNDPLYPWMGNVGYDAQDYRIALRISDDARSLEGSSVMTAVSAQELSAFSLDFGSLEVRSVFVNGTNARYAHDDPKLTITPSKPIPSGETFEVRVDYAGTPDSKVAPPLGAKGRVWNVSRNGLAVFSQPNAMLVWAAVNDHPADKASFTLEITADKAQTAAATGKLISRRDNPDGTTTTTFRADTPTTTYAIMFALGKFILQEAGTVDGVRVRHYLSPGTDEILGATISEMRAMLRFFTAKLGPYPFEEAGVLTTPNAEGTALETQTLITLPIRWSSGPMKAVDNQELVAHELVHQWFGVAVTYRDHSQLFIHEAFARYLAFQWVDQRMRSTPSHTEKNIRDDYASCALGQRTWSLPRDEFAAFIRDEFGPKFMKRQELEGALETLFSGTLPSEYRQQLITEAETTGGVSFIDIANALEKWPVVRVTLTRKAYEALRTLTYQSGLTRAFDDYEPPGLLHAGQSPFNYGVYDCGAMALHALRLKMANEPFYRALRLFVDRFKFKNASNQDFLDAVAEVGGQEARNLLQRWISEPAPDFPELGLFRKDVQPGAVWTN